MGSGGSGRLTDYPGSGKSSKGKAGGDAGGGGVPPQTDRCARAISTNLEDVEQSAYFKAHKACPPKDTRLQIAHQKRLVAQTDAGEVVGNLPTRFNYLADCIADGYSYVGYVRNSGNGPPVATVAADFTAMPSNE
jgi:hypothetical protein